jgi:hypothetical protein
MKRLLSLFILSLLLTASLRADVPCAASYEAAKTAVVSMRLGRGLELKLLTKIENAWRMSRSGKTMHGRMRYNSSTSRSGCWSGKLPPLPRGNLEIEASTVADDKSYYGDAVVALTSNVRVIVNMLYTTDKINGVPLYRVEPLTFGVTPSTQAVEMGEGLERERLDRARRFSVLGSLATFAVSATADTNSASVSVTGAARDQAVTRTATLAVPQGTPSIILRYEVRTAEYPFYVLAQSIFNDWWYLEVTAATNGARLFRRLRQINSQLSLEPIWQTNGSTGELQ